MGYTHYFQQKLPVTEQQWLKITKAASAIIDEAIKRGIPLAYEWDEPHFAPSVTPVLIRFNGIGDDGHETFLLARDSEPGRTAGDKYRFQFCKTAHKPYDIAVVAILTLCHRYTNGAWDIGSDGEPDEWKDGVALACEVTGKKMLSPILK